jgi:UDP-N-acetylglucosamine 4-epimerase
MNVSTPAARLASAAGTGTASASAAGYGARGPSTTRFAQLQQELRLNPRTWLVTGVAGFIGSNLLQALLTLDQTVVGLDNFATGHQRNLDEVCASVSAAQWARFRFLQGDVRVADDCHHACAGVQLVLHQAALGSVPRSIVDPVATHATNLTGFLHIALAAREAGVQRLVYASSSSVYGDHPALPKVEEHIGNPLSPYALTKLGDELYAQVLARTHGLHSVGLRYFNVFGPRQDPSGPYAAVIPKWTQALLRGEDVTIYGDGQTSRDFCYVENAVQANLLAATASHPEALNRAYNVAVGERTSLLQLHDALRLRLAPRQPRLYQAKPRFAAERAGDVRHSQADIAAARTLLGYEPTHRFADGLGLAVDWMVARG